MYLLRSLAGKPESTAAGATIRSQFRPKYREKGRHTLPGLGTIREVETAGIHRDKLEVALPHRETSEKPIQVRGRYAGSRPVAQFDVGDAREHVRVMRPKDLEELERLNEKLEEARRAVSEARKVRDEHLKRSWRYAEPVRNGELVKMAEAELEARAAVS